MHGRRSQRSVITCTLADLARCNHHTLFRAANGVSESTLLLSMLLLTVFRLSSTSIKSSQPLACTVISFHSFISERLLQGAAFTILQLWGFLAFLWPLSNSQLFRPRTHLRMSVNLPFRTTTTGGILRGLTGLRLLVLLLLGLLGRGIVRYLLESCGLWGEV